MKKLIVLLACILFLVFANTAMAITISLSSDIATLENNLISTMLGSGISVSNVTYTGALNASGTFTNGTASGIGIDSGIVLTSGAAMNVDGLTNNNDAITTDNGLAGDSDLDTLIPGYSTHDATIFEFDFESSGGDVYFNYVFGSEEYNEWVGSAFNDVFGFFLDGSNIALLPDGTTTVAINNVNNGTNPAYYNDNDPGDTSIPFDFEYDGFTTVLTASFLGLTPGTHHMKFGVADAGDWILDSGVFIQSGTFSDEETPPVPEPATILLLSSGLIGLAGARKKFK